MNFNEMGLPQQLTQSLERMNFTIPTPIQEKTVALACQGRDILGTAKTGTGKTLAFALPALAHLIRNEGSVVIVLTPTRELAQQVANAIRDLIGPKGFTRVALLIGGESFPRQLDMLYNNPRVIVGTPGRIIDHFERRTLRKFNFSFLVLDETDRMFDMGFSGQIEEIIKQLPKERQTLMFSATMDSKIERLASVYLNNPERVSVDSTIKPSENIKQETKHLKENEKYDVLVDELGKREGSVIIFVKTKHATERLAQDLEDLDYSTCAIHGDLRQNRRERVMGSFRKGRHRIMVATDVAARGLDIPHIQHVINYDLPHCPEDYIHRIGRTGRAGADGSALNLVSSQDRKKWDAIQRLINPELAKQQSSSRNGFGGDYSGDRRGGGSRSGFGSSRSGGARPERRFGNGSSSSSSSSRGGFGGSRDGGSSRERENSKDGFFSRDKRSSGSSSSSSSSRSNSSSSRSGGFKPRGANGSSSSSRGGFGGGRSSRPQA